MAGKTSDPKKLYTWAISAVCDEMKGLGFSVHCNNEREDHTTVIFENSKGRYGIRLPYQSDHSQLWACEPFSFTSTGGETFHKPGEELKITLLGITEDEGAVIKYVSEKIGRLFGK